MTLQKGRPSDKYSTTSIGAATARLAAEHDYAVCVNYRRGREPAEAVAADIEAAGGHAIAVTADVSREADVEALFAVVDERLGTVTALVNNSGVLESQIRVTRSRANITIARRRSRRRTSTGCSYQQIGEHSGVHFTTVGRIMRAAKSRDR